MSQYRVTLREQSYLILEKSLMFHSTSVESSPVPHSLGKPLLALDVSILQQPLTHRIHQYLRNNNRVVIKHTKPFSLHCLKTCAVRTF